MTRLENLKRCLDDMERKEQEESVLKLLAKYNIEGERPTKFFCQMTKKLKGTAQKRILIAQNVKLQ